jgi:hypothetical protein
MHLLGEQVEEAIEQAVPRLGAQALASSIESWMSAKAR